MADDLTGALDSSCMFPPKGFKTRVYSDLPENTDRLKKDIAILARSGFNFETSKKVMDLEKNEYLKIINLL